MLKRLGKIIKWLALTLLICVIAFFVVNQFDETLHPDAALLLQAPSVHIPPHQNAYFTLIGLSAPSGVSAAEWGQKIARNPLSITEPSPIKPACDLETQHCLRAARLQPDVLQKALQDHQILQTRYLAARQLPQFEEDTAHAISDPLPNFSTAFRAQTLRHAQMALWVEAGNIRAVMAELAADIAFQRRCLAGARTLIGKLVSLAALQRDYVFLADLMRERADLMASQTTQLHDLLRPLTPAEQTMLPAMQHEFRMSAGSIRDFHYDFVRSELGYTSHAMDALLNPLADSLLVPNATLNRLYRLAQADEALAQASPAQFGAAHSAAQDLAIQFNDTRWDKLYNPVGKFLIDLSRPDYHRYIRRPLEINVFINLLALQQQLIEQKVADADIPAILAHHPQRNPFDGKPISWDAPRHELFIPLDSTAIQYKRFGKGHHRIAVPL